MNAPKQILEVWHKFDAFPMETLTKAWYYDQSSDRQRSVALMKEHRERYGTSGNCFDLAIWLIDEFQQAGIEAYAIGEGFGTEEAHAAVCALDEQGRRYFCDLGDQWIEPILMDFMPDEYRGEALSGFITGGRIKLNNQGSNHLSFTWVRPNGKTSSQVFDLTPVVLQDLNAAGEHSQSLLRNALVEMRVPMENEVVHWEYEGGRSFISSNQELITESPLHHIEDWAQRIYKMTGIQPDVSVAALKKYRQIATAKP
ncbi:hypothetical protein ACFQ3J_12610 [Paenibacillus provencensis]|uniref:Uncharacterized protein n=1 Tax=Paenibacillus provencensis TaxID=441151 RepID=A0ABW3Q4E0_9BACL|nr:hypothetical protein [Paenibacillus sp. MER 78]MCM3127482.1 hypothetical protein [Paenibacillus sp. MER 78]